MLQVLIGLLAGAVFAGGVQLVLAARDRRRAARVASLRFWVELWVASKLLKDDRSGKRPVTTARLRQALEVWNERQEQFAAGRTAHDFYAVMSGFNAIRRQADLRDAGESGAAQLAADLAQLERAYRLSWRASISRFDSSLDPDKVSLFAPRERRWLKR